MIETETATPAVKLTKAGVPRKKKESKDFRILPGSLKLAKYAENVRQSIGELATFDEKVRKVAVALEISEDKAREQLKAPDGFSDVLELRKAIRLAIMRPEVCRDGLFLARLALFIAPAIGENNLIVHRTKAQKALEVAEGVTL